MLHIALKEWAVICDLLLAGEQAILLRKGGVHEDDGPGRFRLEHDRFALFPAWEHQNPDGIKPRFRDRVEMFEREPEQFELQGIGEAARIWPVPSREAFDALDDLHGWTTPLIDMRFNYKPDRPLYLLVVRAFRLVQPKTIRPTPAYWGCKSWVTLSDADAVEDADTVPVLDDDKFAAIVERIESVFSHR